MGVSVASIQHGLVGLSVCEEGLLARQREPTACDQRVLAPADSAIGRALAHAVAVANMQRRAVFPQLFQGHQEPRVHRQAIRLAALRLALCLGLFQHGHHLDKRPLPHLGQPSERRLRHPFIFLHLHGAPPWQRQDGITSIAERESSKSGYARGPMTFAVRGDSICCCRAAYEKFRFLRSS